MFQRKISKLSVFLSKNVTKPPNWGLEVERLSLHRNTHSRCLLTTTTTEHLNVSSDQRLLLPSQRDFCRIPLSDSHVLSQLSFRKFQTLQHPALDNTSYLPCCKSSVRCYRTAARNRSQSSNEDSKTSESKDSKQPLTDPANESIFQRFKQAYREHGKILIGVHLITSSVWFGSFFYAASVGIDVVPWLEHIGVNETLIKPFRSPNVGNIAMAYLMYKLATPARYTVTLGGTNMVIRYMRRTGRMDPVPEGDSLRELYKDSKEQLKEKRHHIRKGVIKKGKRHS